MRFVVKLELDAAIKNMEIPVRSSKEWIAKAIQNQVRSFEKGRLVNPPHFFTGSGYDFCAFCSVASQMGYDMVRYDAVNNEFWTGINVTYHKHGRLDVFGCTYIESKNGGVCRG